eukprot:gene5137-5644_t
MAEIPAVSVSNEREIQPLQLSLEQLNSLKTQHEEELQQLQRQGETLVGAKNRFLTVKATLSDLQQSQKGQKLLIPLNSSLYVPGEMLQPEKVIVELGTGYFCEKDLPSAVELIDRKTHLVNKSIESVENIAVQKRKNLEQIVQVMQYKISMLQQQQQESAQQAK